VTSQKTIKLEKEKNPNRDRVVLPCTETFEFIRLSEIIRCEGSHNNSRVYMTDGKVLLSTLTIGVFKKILPEVAFFCTHKSHVISIGHIRRYNKEGYVEMSDGSTVPVSRRTKDSFFRQIIDKYNICSTNLSEEPEKINDDRKSHSDELLKITS